ncbi:LolA family protein [Alkalicoccobacillus gibsonii]|uniref:LolA family protein n=1 Tax=Alkalicoccobacillus gibsonii TaxID=79881 RepID=UPI003517C7C3
MKKAIVLSVTGAVFLAACGSEEEGQTATANETEETGTEEAVSEDTDDAPSAKEIVEEAIAFYDGLTSLYMVSEGEVSVDLDGEQENVPEGDISTSITETHWNFIQEDELYTRMEAEFSTEGEEDGEAFSDEMPTTYQFSDLDDPALTITYDEGDEEAIRYEQGIDPTQDDLSDWASLYETLLEDAELTYVGEEEINGYSTYHIEAERDGQVTEYWFDQETFYEIKMESETAVEDAEYAAGDTSSSGAVIEFEVNPDFDESLFQAPDDVEVVDGELEDTLSSNMDN